MRRASLAGLINIILLLTLTGPVTAADGLAQLMVRTQYPILRLTVTGVNQYDANVSNTWNFSQDENVTFVETTDWWWRFQYYKECDWWCQLNGGSTVDTSKGTPVVTAYVTYIDGFEEYKNCSNLNIGELAQFSLCDTFTYTGPPQDNNGTGNTGGSTGSGSGGSGDSQPLPPQVTGFTVPTELELGQRPFVDVLVYNPNSAPYPLTSPGVLVATDIPLKFNPSGSRIGLTGGTINAQSSLQIGGSPSTLFYTWIDPRWPVVDICDRGPGEYIQDIFTALTLNLLSEKLTDGIDPNVKTTEEALRIVAGYSISTGSLIKDIADSGGNLNSLYNSDVGQVFLTEGTFTLTADVASGANQPAKLVTFRVPQNKQTSFISGLNALYVAVPAMSTTKIITGAVDSVPFQTLLGWWAGPIIASADGVAMAIACKPIANAYQIDAFGPVIYANQVTTLRRLRLVDKRHMARRSAHLSALYQTSGMYGQYILTLQGLTALSAKVLELGLQYPQPNPGEFRKIRNELTPLLDNAQYEINQLIALLPGDNTGTFSTLDTVLDFARLELATIEEALANGDVRLLICMGIRPDGPPIQGSGEIHGTDGNDIIIGSNQSDVIYGGAGNDCILGDNGEDTIYGGDGSDLIIGNNGSDMLYGENGDDIIYGGNGPDYLSGGPGTDVLIGENGPDVFDDEEGTSTGTDYNENSDHIGTCDPGDQSCVVKFAMQTSTSENTQANTQTAQPEPLATCNASGEDRLVIGGPDDPLHDRSHCGFRNAQKNVALLSLDAAGIGNESVLNHRPIAAVDVTGWLGDGVEICFWGKGGVLFLDAAAAPRTPQWMPASLYDEFTCTTITTPGSLVLVADNADTLGPSSQNPVVMGSRSVTLANCRITTNNILNLRSAPIIADNILQLVPYNSNLQAIEYVPGWYRVIFGDQNGWVSEDYLVAHGTCAYP